MGAIVGTRYGKNDRTELQKVIPLETPYLLFVDPSSVCNLRCKFCPCGGGNKEVWSKEKKTSILPYEVFRKIIDDLKDFPQKIKTLRLYKEGEPLVNPHLAEMISYARKRDVADRIDFTTNGTLFSHDRSLAITDAGVDRINISIEALTEKDYFEVSGVKLDYKSFLGNLSFLYHNKNGCHIFVKISDYGLKDHTEEEFFNTFADIADEMAIEHITPVWPEFSMGNEEKKGFDIYGGKMEERVPVQVCPYLFYSLCVNSDATVSACLMDWNHKLIVGNAKENSIKSIWNSEIMNNMRKDHLSLKKDKYLPCGKCGQLQFAVLDNIDAYREEILRRMPK